MTGICVCETSVVGVYIGYVAVYVSSNQCKVHLFLWVMVNFKEAMYDIKVV